MNNYEVAGVFDRIGDLLEVKGESGFRVNAYREAARQLRALPGDVNEVARAGELRAIPGVGEAIALKIDELLKTGTLDYLERLRREVPESLVELLQVPGLGPRKVQFLYKQIGVQSLADLKEAASAGRIRELEGMGPKTEQNILRELSRLQERTRRLPVGIARPAAEEMVELLRRACAAVERVSVGGSIRRGRDTIGDIDLVVASREPAAVLDCFVALPPVKETIGRGDTKASILTHQNLQMDLRVVAPGEWGAALVYFTGSKAHNIRLRDLAIARGWRLNEYSIVDEATGQRLESVDEEDDVYRLLDLPMMPPEIREDTGEFEAARAGALPRLVTVDDIRGDLHAHSDWSDGGSTIETMAAVARDHGYAYLAFTDHSQSLGVAGGLTPERVREQRKVIDEINRRFPGFRLLHGIELEIRADGSLDFPDEVLAELDLVIASVHSGFSQTREVMTARMIQAVRNPHVDIIGHPTGRIIGRRDPYDIDVDALIDACAETGTGLEINANPNRLDLPDESARRARDRGVPIAINTDAHAPDNFDLLHFGITAARRAWLEPRHVLNTRSLDDLLAWLRR